MAMRGLLLGCTYLTQRFYRATATGENENSRHKASGLAHTASTGYAQP
jgi:hypothetical protein